MADEKLGLGEQMLGKAAEAAIATQVEQADKLVVEVSAPDGLKTLQGEVSAINIEGSGVVVDKDLRVEQLSVHADTVSIDPLMALLGQIRLDKPLDAAADVVITEVDLNRATNSPLALGYMQELPLKVGHQEVRLSVERVSFSLPNQTQVSLDAEVSVHYPSGNTRQVTFTTVLCIDDQQCISLERFQCGRPTGYQLPLELAGPLLTYVSDFVRSRRLTYGGIVLHVRHIEPRAGSLALKTEAHIEP